MTSLLRALTSVLLLGLLAAGCSDGDADDSDGQGGDEPITPGAVVVIAQEHLDSETAELESIDEEEDGSRTVGASIRIQEASTNLGDLLMINIVDESSDWSCENEDQPYDGCETTQVPGGTLTIIWQEVEPEEDPGIVTVVLQRDGEEIVALYAGDEITGDPRDQDLSINVSTMIDIVTDERMRATTTTEAVEAGEDVEWTEDES